MIRIVCFLTAMAVLVSGCSGLYAGGGISGLRAAPTAQGDLWFPKPE